MTTFTGPVNVKLLDAETTSIELMAGGSARFTDTVRVCGGITVAGGSDMSGIVSARTDIAASGRVMSLGGDVVLHQGVTVNEGTTAGLTAAVIPAGGTILDMKLLRVSGRLSFGTAGATVNIMVGDSSDDNLFGNLTNVSSTAVFAITGFAGTCAQAMVNLAAETNVIFKTTAASGTVSGGQAGAAGAGQSYFSVLYRRGL